MPLKLVQSADKPKKKKQHHFRAGGYNIIHLSALTVDPSALCQLGPNVTAEPSCHLFFCFGKSFIFCSVMGLVMSPGAPYVPWSGLNRCSCFEELFLLKTKNPA